MKENLKEEKCPYCKESKTVVAKQSGYADAMPLKSLSFKSEAIYHVICLNCGTIIRSFVNNPKNLLTKKEKLEKF